MTLVETDQRPVSRIGHEGLIVDERYRLERLIGAGGFGEVWRATQQVEGQEVRPVALKILTAPSGADNTPTQTAAGDGWLNEVRAIREVHCEAVTTIYDVGIARQPRVAFIAMELLSGATLDKSLAAGPIYWRRALAITRTVATALAACHRVGVVHCDLKPPNIFITEAGRIVVLDFGIAALSAEERARQASWTDAAAAAEFGEGFATGAVALDEVPGAAPVAAGFQLVGTPGYIAPEGYAGDSPGPAADVFALGVVLYRMLTGHLPYILPADVDEPVAGTTTREEYDRYHAALNSATSRGDLVPITTIAPATPSAVAALAMNLLAVNPADRPTDDLCAAVDEAWRRPYGTPDPPYVGLEAFDARRTGFIAGRDADIDDIAAKLGSARAVVLSGPSGCGKSSLAAAGVSARIDELMVDARDGWRTVVIRPAADHKRLRKAPPPPPPLPAVGTVVVVDQLEEILNLDEAARVAFCDALATLVDGRAPVTLDDEIHFHASAVRVVATVRDDLFGRVAAIPELRRFPEQNLYTVRGVEPNAIPAIVTGPARAAGYTLEDGEAVAAEATAILKDDSSALPLVQFALTRWWEQRDRETRRLLRSEWARIGGIEGALAVAAQAVYDALADSERVHMRALLIELFRADGTRVRVDESVVVKSNGAAAVLERLIERRLVRRQLDSHRRANLEVVHEALARRWPLLHSWLEETRAERELIQDVKYDAERWQRAGCPAEMLWRGGRLAAVARLHDRVDEAAEFIVAASMSASRQRTTRRGIIGLLLALVAVAIIMVLSYVASNNARREAEDARDKNAALVEEAESAREAALKEQREADKAREAALREKREADIARREATTARDEIAGEKEKVEEQRKLAIEQRELAENATRAAMEARAKTEQALVEVRVERDRANSARTAAEEAKARADQEAKRARAAEEKYKKAERALQRLRETEGIGEPTFP